MTLENEILTPNDIATITGRSLRLVYRMLEKKTIPHVRMGNRYIVKRDVFYRWLEGKAK